MSNALKTKTPALHGTILSISMQAKRDFFQQLDLSVLSQRIS